MLELFREKPEENHSRKTIRREEQEDKAEKRQRKEQEDKAEKRERRYERGIKGQEIPDRG